MPTKVWLPNPPAGVMVAGGFDGSENDDFTAIKLVTVDNLLFTPRYGPDARPTVWNPAEWGGRIPRSEVHAAWEELADRYKIVRAYCDPGFRDESSWETEIESWDQLYGPKVFVPWQMSGGNRIESVYRALKRFEADLDRGNSTMMGVRLRLLMLVMHARLRSRLTVMGWVSLVRFRRLILR